MINTIQFNLESTQGSDFAKWSMLKEKFVTDAFWILRLSKYNAVFES